MLSYSSMKKSPAPLHVSEGRVHVGTALSLAGLAILLSGSLVYAAIPAKRGASDTTLINEVRRMRAQLDKLADNVDQIRQQCVAQPKETTTATESTPIPDNCIIKCKDVTNGNFASYQECVEKICTQPAAPSINEESKSESKNQPNANVPPQPSFDLSACLNTCEENARDCSEKAGKKEDRQQACTNANNDCTKKCKETTRR